MIDGRIQETEDSSSNCIPGSAEGIDLAGARDSSPLRALHVVSGNLYGGVERILVTFARLRNLCPNMEPHFAVCSEGRLSQELSALSAPVHTLGPVRISRPWSVLRARQRMGQLLRRERIDVVVCHMAWTQAIFGPAVRRAGAPLVFYLHNRTDGRHWLDRWARAAATPDLALCVSRDTASTCANIYPHAPYEVFYSPLPLDRVDHFGGDRSRVRSELGTAEDSPVIIQVSRMEAWKGQQSLLEALGRLRDRQDWTCWIVGGAQTAPEVEYARALQSLAKERGIEQRVRFLGERSDVSKLMAAADLFCQPNKATEGFSIVFLEAFLARLPVITTAIGGAIEIVDESCGVLLPMNDLEGLVEALRGLLDDPQRRGALGRAGYRRVHETCEPRAQLDKLKKILGAVAAASVPSRGGTRS